MVNPYYHAIGDDQAHPDKSSLAPPNYTQTCPPRKPIPTLPNTNPSPIDERSISASEHDRPLVGFLTEEGRRAGQPQPHSTFARLLIDVFLMALPCLFIALAIIAAYLSGRAISSYGEKVQDAAKLGPTLFPIIFAAIVARFNRLLATWQAERGERLGVLEQLMQSQSLSSSIVAAFNLRNFSVTGSFILLLWALSPLGGQSSLRVLSTTIVNNQTQTSVYSATVAPWQYFGGLAHEVITSDIMNSLFGACLAAPDSVKDSPVDTWGNVKIPASKYVSDLDAGAWYAVGADTSYSSLVGVPLFSVPQVGTANFSILWQIFDTECLWNPTAYTPVDWCWFVVDNWPPVSGSYIQTTNDTCTFDNATQTYNGMPQTDTAVGWLTTDLGNDAGDDGDFNATQLSPNSTPRYTNITWTTQGYLGNPGANATCKLVTTRVEAEIFCVSGNCGVTRMRRANESIPDFINPWNDASDTGGPAIQYDIKVVYLDTLLQYLPPATGTTNSWYPTPFEAFLIGWQNPFNQTGYGYIDLNVDNSTLSTQLSVAFNTYWTISQWNQFITNHSATISSDTAVINDSSGALASGYQQSTSTTITQRPVYQANYVWITILLVISVILLICTLASLLLRIFTIAPDILGYVSSFTRDSPYFEPLGPGGTLLTGEQRARWLRDMKVQIADIRPEAEVGHVAFVNTDQLVNQNGVKRDFARLVKGRLYD